MVNKVSARDNKDNESLDEVIYQQLKSLARKLMVKERNNHTLSATDLVHEAFVKLSHSAHSYNDQKHYFHTFARQMRHVLVNHSYHKKTKKNKGISIFYTDSLGLVDNDYLDFTEINNAIEALKKMDQRSAHCIELIYFTDLKQSQAARMMGISLPTLERDINFGRAFINEFIYNLGG